MNERTQDPLRLDFLRIAADPDQLTWQAFRPGVRIHRVYGGGDDEPSAAFLRYEPGASVPPHEHQGYEHIFILNGSQEDERGQYRAGEFVLNPPGLQHTVVSAEGCLVFIVWNRPVRFTK